MRLRASKSESVCILRLSGSACSFRSIASSSAEADTCISGCGWIEPYASSLGSALKYRFAYESGTPCPIPTSTDSPMNDIGTGSIDWYALLGRAASIASTGAMVESRRHSARRMDSWRDACTRDLASRCSSATTSTLTHANAPSASTTLHQKIAHVMTRRVFTSHPRLPDAHHRVQRACSPCRGPS